MGNESNENLKSGGASDVPEHTNTEASGLFKTLDGKTIEIRDVWASNLEEENGTYQRHNRKISICSNGH